MIANTNTANFATSNINTNTNTADFLKSNTITNTNMQASNTSTNTLIESIEQSTNDSIHSILYIWNYIVQKYQIFIFNRPKYIMKL